MCPYVSESRKLTATSGSKDKYTTDYLIFVQTGRDFGAGTDANVFIRLHGTRGQSEEFLLTDSRTNLNKFERGFLDKFLLKKKPGLGTLEHVDVRFDNTGVAPAWQIEEIRVHDCIRSTFLYCYIFEKRC